MTIQRDSVINTRTVRFPVYQLLIFYLPVAVVILAASTWYVSFRTDSRLTEIIANERNKLEHMISFIGAEVSSALHHLRSLTDESLTKQVLASPGASAINTLKSSFLTLARRNPFYQQVRWIDEKGMEQIRIERRKDHGKDEPYAVASRDLQNKNSRYYFKAANALSAGHLYVSRLDLNVEHGEIEMPPKPMLRIAAPVTDEQGHRRGIIVINIAVKYIFDVIAKIARERVDSDYMVLNEEGYQLSGTPQVEQIEQGLFRDIRFSKSYPGVWKVVSETRSGNLESAQGLWVWQTFSPANTIRGMVQALSRDEVASPKLYFDPFFITLVAHKPIADLMSLRSEIRMPITIGVIVVLAAYGFSLYLLLRSSVRERESELNVTTAMAYAASMARLKELEERFRRLFEASSTGLVVVDDKGTIELSNAAAEAIFGYEKGELEGLPVENLLPHDEQEKHASLRRSFMLAPETRKMGEGRQLKAILKDGRKISVEVGLSPFLDGGRQLVLANVIDVSKVT
jgi:PAS domain S-box-containing protein